MHRLTIGTLALAAILVLSDGPAFAQMGGMGMPSMGGMGGSQRPKRRLHRNQSPALSPALNMVPGASTTFEGQFLMRTLPMEQYNRTTAQTGRALEGMQNRIDQQETQIKSGIGKTGHSAAFMNYHGYYSLGKGGGGSRRN